MACKELKREILDSGNSFLHNSDYVFLKWKKIVKNQSINKSPKIAYRWKQRLHGFSIVHLKKSQFIALDFPKKYART